MPQGLVLGPLLFPLYINDVPRFVLSKVKLYADGKLLYRVINTPKFNDIAILQQDLDFLSQEWQMSFNTSKCVHLTITLKALPLPSKYSISNYDI